MVMQRCHFKNPAAPGGLEKTHLKNNRQGFDDKQAPHQYQQYLLLGDDRHRSQGRTQGQ